MTVVGEKLDLFGSVIYSLLTVAIVWIPSAAGDVGRSAYSGRCPDAVAFVRWEMAAQGPVLGS